MPEVFASFDTNIILDLFIPSYHRKVVEDLIKKLKKYGIEIKISDKVVEEVLKVGDDLLKEAEQIINEMIEYLRESKVRKLSLKHVGYLEEFFNKKFKQYKEKGREHEYNRLILHSHWIMRKIEEILLEKSIRLNTLKMQLRTYVSVQYITLKDGMIYFIHKTAKRIESGEERRLVNERLVNELKRLGFKDFDSKILSSLIIHCYDSDKWGVFVTRDYNLVYLKERRKIPLTITTPTFALLNCLLIIRTEKRSYRTYFEVQASDRIKDIVRGPSPMYV